MAWGGGRTTLSLSLSLSHRVKYFWLPALNQVTQRQGKSKERERERACTLGQNRSKAEGKVKKGESNQRIEGLQMGKNGKNGKNGKKERNKERVTVFDRTLLAKLRCSGCPNKVKE